METKGVVRFSFLETELPDRKTVDITFYELRNRGYRVTKGYQFLPDGGRILRFVVEKKTENPFQDLLL